MWKAFREERSQPPETVFHSAPPDKQTTSAFNAGLFTFVAITFILGGGLGTLFVGLGKYQFRQLPIDNLIAVEVYVAEDQYQVAKSPTARLENTDYQVKSGLNLLRNCGQQSVQHEHFLDGYVLRLIFDDPSLNDYYISVFRRSSASPKKTIVMPQRERLRNTNLGEYECPEFQNWVTQKIDPLFANRNTPQH